MPGPQPFAWRFAAICLALLLAGCGFRPLYGSGGESGSVQTALASIAIPEPETRLAQIIRNDLISSFRPPGTSAPDDYTLLLRSGSNESNSIETEDSATARKTVKVNASYQLVDRRNGQTVSSGKTFSQVSYDRTGRSFADLQAQTNALERAAHEISLDIRSRLAAHFATN